MGSVPLVLEHWRLLADKPRERRKELGELSPDLGPKLAETPLSEGGKIVVESIHEHTEWKVSLELRGAA
jgi:hypothetical protein